MPRVPKQWLDSIVYIYGTEADARAGARTGATGFVVSMPPDDPDIPDGVAHHYVVTNDHVVRGRGALALRVNLSAGGFDVLTVHESEWACHPNGDDVTAVPLMFDFPAHRYAAVNRSMMLTDELLAKWDFGPGDEVFFIGRYVDLDGKAYNVPVVRSGILSAFPAEPIDQRPGRAHEQESILVEARSLSGFSGSPVFVTPSALIAKSNDFDGAPEVRPLAKGPCYFLGIDWGHRQWPELVRDPATRNPIPSRLFTEGNSGMLMVVPAKKLIELLDGPKLASKRREVEDHERELIAQATATNAISLDEAEPEDEFVGFEALTDKLLRVPKTELDEKLRESSE